jgi:hypothetical protein
MLTIGVGRTPETILDVAPAAAGHFGVELSAHAAHAA